MSPYVLNFLDAGLKGDAKAAAFLANKPTANGVPPHMISMDLRHNQRSLELNPKNANAMERLKALKAG